MTGLALGFVAGFLVGMDLFMTGLAVALAFLQTAGFAFGVGETFDATVAGEASDATVAGEAIDATVAVAHAKECPSHGMSWDWSRLDW